MGRSRDDQRPFERCGVLRPSNRRMTFDDFYTMETQQHRELRSYFNPQKEEKHKCHEEMEQARTEWDR